jgi:lipoate-protein ligase A
MKYLDLTLATPQHNLACDEALLELCEDGYGHDILRVWEPREPFVVLGYSSRIAADVKLLPCRRLRVPIFRRCSGGGTVLQGPGCLNVTVILRMERRPELATISGTTAFVLRRHRLALEPLVGRPIQRAGLSDLALDGLKFSGNAQRRKRRCVLVHGTILHGLDLALVERCLKMPQRQPAYRRRRAHRRFLVNLALPAQALKAALARAWGADSALERLPGPRIEELAGRYASAAWTRRC